MTKNRNSWWLWNPEGLSFFKNNNSKEIPIGSSHFLIVKKNTRENYKVSVSQNKYDKKNVGTLTSFLESEAELIQQKP